MTDSIAAMTFDLAAAQLDPIAGAGGGAAAGGGASVFDVARFESQMQAPTGAAAGVAAPPPSSAVASGGFQSVLKTLESLNGRVENLGSEAFQFAADKQELSPGDMLNLTVKAHQFMFHCELTANVANRTSEGVQQLFRQQS
ncbi:MAG: hypothetical protein K0U79_06830 [Gammaproteobacteria bacterium]|nr:hypothetical protein [Gammaproteobacteria bacterium]